MHTPEAHTGFGIALPHDEFITRIHEIASILGTVISQNTLTQDMGTNPSTWLDHDTFHPGMRAHQLSYANGYARFDTPHLLILDNRDTLYASLDSHHSVITIPAFDITTPNPTLQRLGAAFSQTPRPLLWAS